MRPLFASCLLFLTLPMLCLAQYPPAVGHPGTTAMYKDSSAFVGWATQCTVIRGYQDISNQGMGLVTVGDSSMATGPAGTNGVVSLGDGGSATLSFAWPIVNGPGWDFAVFENSFDDFFLELAFVEVSSDGMNFFRFPAHSLTDTAIQVSSFDSLDATSINNFAGKYRGMYGTPFDLEELSYVLSLDLLRITHVRIIDAVGCVQTAYATYDTAGNKVNDPWPTGFPQGGFDLDAVGVIWDHTNALPENNVQQGFQAFPNPATDQISLNWLVENTAVEFVLRDLCGKAVMQQSFPASEKNGQLEIGQFKPGMYLLQMRGNNVLSTVKILIK